MCLFVLTNQRFVATLSCYISALGQQRWLISRLLCHILIILTIFKLVHPDYICYGDLWSVIFDVTVVTVLRYHRWPHHIRQGT